MSDQTTVKRNALTVDVEDYFQVSAFENHVPKSNWDEAECRIERNVDTILELFDTAGAKATFFTLGWVAQRYPKTVRKIVDHGHELASHGWEHVRATTQTPQEFAADIRQSKQTLEDIGGTEVKGYRAASYSIDNSNPWAWQELALAGYRYSSSIVPIHHDLYGIPDAPRFPFRTADNSLLEIPVTTISLLSKNINCGGGGWFRLFPYAFSHWALKRVNQREDQVANFYFHPWEIDPEQPRISGISAKTRFRHYLNLSRMQPRLQRLLQDFQWGRMDDIYLPKQA